MKMIPSLLKAVILLGRLNKTLRVLGDEVLLERNLSEREYRC